MWRTLRSPGFGLFSFPLGIAREVMEELAVLKMAHCKSTKVIQYMSNPLRPCDKEKY